MPTLIQQSPPSYKQGFARSAGKSACPNLWRGLVGSWVPALGNTGSTIPDVSGYGNNGTYGPVGFTTGAGVYQGVQSIGLDGTNDEIVIPNNARLFGMAQFSAVAWIRYRGSTSDTNEKNVIDAWNTGDTNYLIRWDPANDEWDFFTDTSAGILGVNATDLANPEDRNWHVLVATYDGATMRLYLDGVVSSTTGAQTGTIDAGATDVSIGGQWAGSATDFWHGENAETLIYNRALTPNEAQLLWRDPLAPFRRKIQIPYATPVAAGGVTPKGVFGMPLNRPLRGPL